MCYLPKNIVKILCLVKNIVFCLYPLTTYNKTVTSRPPLLHARGNGLMPKLSSQNNAKKYKCICKYLILHYKIKVYYKRSYIFCQVKRFQNWFGLAKYQNVKRKVSFYLVFFLVFPNLKLVCLSRLWGGLGLGFPLLNWRTNKQQLISAF